jgi:hypothetical protein
MADPSRAAHTVPPVIAEYSSRFRVVELWATWIFAALFAALAARSGAAPLAVSSIQTAVMLAAGVMAADLASGLVHWAADTWGDQTWPIVGPTLIRSFREHHVDQQAITGHRFVEANGATALVLLPVMVAVHLALPGDRSAWTHVHDQASVLALSVTFFAFMTNQIHKWAHLDRPPRVVRLLQACHVILTADHHQAHHTGHLTRYCITTGWLNPLLDRLRFFRIAETLIQGISRLRAREDDAKLVEMVAAIPASPISGGEPAPRTGADIPSAGECNARI